jgi:hypothetical protein
MRRIATRVLTTTSVFLAATIFAASTQFLCAQAAGPIGMKEGDSLTVVVHHVPAAKRAQYERWMTTVWWPAARKAGSKSAEYGRAIKERRRYVPAEPADSGTLTYLFLYPHSPAGVHTKRQGMGAALELSGMPAGDIDKQLADFEALGVKVEGLLLVQHEYR